MPRLRSQAAKNSLLRRVRRQRLKYITVLPSLITILNGICGLAAITFASKGAGAEIGHFSYHKLQLPYFALAGYMILVAMIADVLDGRLARMSKSTSSFGGQLDSLCDIISFGVAPAFLMLQLLQHRVALAELSLSMESFLARFIWLVAAAYFSCAAIRLARFNVENEEDESAHMSFIGLPTPAAAGVIVCMVIFHQESLPELSDKSSQAYAVFDLLITYALPFVTLGVAVLMVSRIRYAHVINQYTKGKKPFAHLIRALLFLALIIWRRQEALLFIFSSFALSGFVKWFYFKFVRKTEPLLGAVAPQQVQQQ